MINFLEIYRDKGHLFGDCMGHPDSDLIYVNIPKNASSWTKQRLIDSGWEFYNYHSDNLYHKHAIIVLRDPVDRWLSGIAEYMYLYHNKLDVAHFSNCFFDLVFDRIAFDDHTEQQVLFFEKLDAVNSTFFWCDKNYRKLLSTFFKYKGIQNNYQDFEYQHVTDNDANKKKFKELFKQTLNKNSKYIQKLNLYFAKDYNLIRSVKFYAG